MILPIVGYGDPVLRKVGEAITPDYPNLKETIANMYETMYNAYGVGLAAPQVGIAIRLFVIDTAPFSDDEELKEDEQKSLKGFKKTFINPKIIKEEGARVIQHEYDHIEGILFTDKISSLKKRLIQKKLKNIIEGKTFQEYRMKFASVKKGR